MSTRMQQRRGTANQWISTNQGNGPILSPGEIGFESDTNKFKIGDGINHWVDLTYFTDAESITTALNNIIDGAPAALNTLNELAAALGDDANFLASLATESYVDTAIGNIDALPSQTGNAGEFLTTDGTTASWATVDLSDVSTLSGTETLQNKTIINPVITYRELTEPSVTMLFSGNATFFALKKADGSTYIGPNGVNEWFYSEDAQPTYLTNYPDAVGVRVLNSDWNQTFNGTFAQAVTAGYITYDDGSNDFTVSPIEVYRLDGITSNIQSQINAKASIASLNDHSANTGVHGVAGTIVGTDNIQTLTNKTLFNPSITVQEITTPGSITLKPGYVYTFVKPDNSTYPSLNGQNNLWDDYYSPVVLLSQVPLATRINVIPTSNWQSLGTLTFAQADTADYIDYQPTVTSDTAISNIEIKYLDGVTSNIQTQLNAKLESSDIADLATESYVDTAVGNSEVDQSTLAGTGLDWTGTQFEVDTTTVFANPTISSGLTLDGTGDFTVSADANIILDATTEVYIGSAASGNEVATKSYADAAAAAIVDAAPGTLNTLNELAAAINDDASYAAGITTALGNKQDKVTDVSDTEIGYLNGVTSGIQAQLDGKTGSSNLQLISTDYLPGTTGFTISSLSTYSIMRFVIKYAVNFTDNNYLTLNFNNSSSGWDMAVMGGIGGYQQLSQNYNSYGPRSIFLSTDGSTSNIASNGGVGTEFTVAVDIAKANTPYLTEVTITSSYYTTDGSPAFMVQSGVFDDYAIISSINIAASSALDLQYRLWASTTP